MSHPDYKDVGTPTQRFVEETGELMMELGKALHAIGKAERFGLDGFHPERPDVLNRDLILQALSSSITEIADVHRAITALQIELLDVKSVEEFEVSQPCHVVPSAWPPVTTWLSTEAEIIDLFCSNQKLRHFFAPLDGLTGLIGFRDTEAGIDYTIPMSAVREKRLGPTFSLMLSTQQGRKDMADAISTGMPVPLHHPPTP